MLIIYSMFLILLCVVVTENITEVIVKSKISFPLRSYIDKKSESNKFFGFLNELLTCGYCTSFWVSLFVTTSLFCFIDTFIVNRVFDFIVFVIVIHRLSNVLHFFIDFLDKNRY